MGFRDCFQYGGRFFGFWACPVGHVTDQNLPQLSIVQYWVEITNIYVRFWQITSLPPSAFWSSLVFLQFLHLHDNPIGDIDAIHSLARCHSLSVLTIYDTPLSLKRNYRHHVVNTIWSLKALDHHVISDEEIIEDAIFTRRFATMAPSFQLDLCPATEVSSLYWYRVPTKLWKWNSMTFHDQIINFPWPFLRSRFMQFSRRNSLQDNFGNHHIHDHILNTN